MPVSDEEKRIVAFLQLDPVGEGTHIVAKVEFSRGAHAAQDALLASGGCRVRFGNRSLRRGRMHQSLIRLFLKMSIAGPSSGPRKGTVRRTSIQRIAIPAMSNTRRARSGRKCRSTWLPS